MPAYDFRERAFAKRFAVLRFGPTGFRCFTCGHLLCYWVSPERPRMQQCRRCGAQQSVLSGTALAYTKLPLWIWFDRAARVDDGQLPSSTQVAREYGIARSSAWHLTQRILAVMRETFDIPDDDLLHRLRVFEVNCRRPQATPPLSDEAPAEVRQRRDDFLKAPRRQRLATHVVFRLTPDVVTVHTPCLPPGELTEVKKRGSIVPFHRTLARWVQATLHRKFNSVSLRWLPRYLGHLALLWNNVHDRMRPLQHTPCIERLAFSPAQPLHALRPWGAIEPAPD